MTSHTDFLRCCLTRACMYLQKGYIDKTEKDEFTVMDWERYIMNEVENDCERVPESGEKD